MLIDYAGTIEYCNTYSKWRCAYPSVDVTVDFAAEKFTASWQDINWTFIPIDSTYWGPAIFEGDSEAFHIKWIDKVFTMQDSQFYMSDGLDFSIRGSLSQVDEPGVWALLPFFLLIIVVGKIRARRVGSCKNTTS